ncbi:MAG: 1-acyl-sn-glycerol-3-phosphate acyltransferase [Gammaproteobacteria bacterium]|nr:1-acyl-sn-glycerol-3-phosphate acyltransferase [Gammaproteobacteria bacterium]
MLLRTRQTPLPHGGIVRAGLFYVGYVLFTVFWGTLSVTVGWAMPARQRFEFIIGIWSRRVLGWLRLTCGIRVEVQGLEHIPRQACVVFAHHESTWETLFLQSLFRPQATLIKRELLWIPFFGWAFALNKPIAIDRGSPRQALRKLIDTGRSRLADGTSVVLFPEGTRMPPGEIGSFQPGGAALAIAAEAPVVVVAHNAGRYWPAHRLRKTPGVIQVRIGPPVATAGRKSKAVNAEARELMAALVKRLD